MLMLQNGAFEIVSFALNWGGYKSIVRMGGRLSRGDGSRDCKKQGGLQKWLIYLSCTSLGHCFFHGVYII